jgi:hypothetical protein
MDIPRLRSIYFLVLLSRQERCPDELFFHASQHLDFSGNLQMLLLESPLWLVGVCMIFMDSQ